MSIDFSRRSMLSGIGTGLLATPTLARRAHAQTIHPMHHRPTATSVIWLFMEGGPSACDTFDPKPELKKRAGQRPKQAIDVFFGSPGPLMPSSFFFAQHGQSGAWVSELFPAIAKQVDELAFVRSCWSESPNHGPSMFQMNTGFTRAGFPSVGAWVNHALGSTNPDLPGFVVFPNARGSKGGPANWSSGFLSGELQATPLRAGATPILNLRRPDGVSAKEQRSMLDLVGRINERHAASRPKDRRFEAQAKNLELAHRMQTAGADVANLAEEPSHIKKLYGLDNDVTRPYGEKLLMARRLVERGVRFVQAYCNDEWDSHNGLRDQHMKRAAETDVPVAGLLMDLKQRGLLDSTLVIWGGEFGRMPVSEQGDGRDHNPNGFLVWMAGGGIKAGASYGETDEIGFKAAVNPVSVHDLHATILHTLGLDHERVTVRHNGRDYRLTDVSGKVIRELLV